MSGDRDAIRNFYGDGREEGRFGVSRSAAMESHYTVKWLEPHIGPEARILEVGCGTGYYGLLFAGRCAHYTGVDLSPENIAAFRAKIDRQGAQNISAVVGDASDLRDFGDESFDGVFCLGPMYHMPREERQAVFAECRRVARPGAVLAFAYINALGAYAGACVHDVHRKTYPNANANHHVFEKHTDDVFTGVFYYTSPEEMESDAQRHALTVLENHGLDFFFAACVIDAMDDGQFAHYRTLADRMSESRSCVGLANHALLITRKPA